MDWVINLLVALVFSALPVRRGLERSINTASLASGASLTQ